MGLVKGRGLAMLSGNRVECIAAQMAAVLMGVRYTPLHPKAGLEDHLFIIEDAEVDTLLVEAHTFGARGTEILARVRSLQQLVSLGPVCRNSNSSRSAPPSPGIE
jgi:fatty-acyl-CoA synthase